MICIALVRVYQYAIRPHLVGCCKFHPSCSEYSCQALTRFGLLRGGIFAVKRVVRCLPLTAGGYDPVPERTAAESA